MDGWMDDGTTGEMAGRDRLSGGKDWHPESVLIPVCR